jgi:hypothetical protein
VLVSSPEQCVQIYVLFGGGGRCGYSLYFSRLIRMSRGAARFTPLSRTDLASRGFAISLMISRSIALPDSFVALFFSIRP